MDFTRIKKPVSLLLAALGLGLSFDALFYGQNPGINVPLFVGLLLTALFLLGLESGNSDDSAATVATRRRSLWFLVPPLMLFAGLVAFRANDTLTVINICACLLLLAYLAHFYAGHASLLALHLETLLGAPWRVLGHLLYAAAPVVQATLGSSAVRERGKRRALPFLRGLLLATPVLIVFVALLHSADAVFARLVDNALAWIIPEDWATRFWRGVLVIGVAWLSGGGLVYALTQHATRALPVPIPAANPAPPTLDTPPTPSVAPAPVAAPAVVALPGEGIPASGPPPSAPILRPLTAPPAPLTPWPTPKPLELRIGFIETATVLGSVCAVFLAFVLVQFAYLFGHALHAVTAPALSYNILPGLTYKEYAHRGFAELNWTVTLSLALILALKACARREGAAQKRAFNGLATLLVALTQVMLLSSWQRMKLYEAVWGQSEVRVYVDTYIVYLALALVWLTVTLWKVRWSERFAIGALACVFGFAATVNIANPDAYTVRENCAHYWKNDDGSLTEYYSFSVDATPELWHQYQTLPKGNLRDAIGRSLRAQLDTLTQQQKNTAGGGLPSFHVARWQAEQLLEAHAQELPASQGDRK